MMKTWLLLLSGLLIWTANFFGIYIAASLWPGTTTARIVAGLLSLAALGTIACIYLFTIRKSSGDGVEPWASYAGSAGLALAALAATYHGLTAALG